MRDFQQNGTALAEIPKGRSQGLRLAELGQRLSKTFARSDPEYHKQHRDDELQQTQALDWQDDMPRFAVVRHGYHCAAVDEYVAELEQELGEMDRELAELRTQPRAPASDDVASEIKRIGEETSTVLIAAHEQAQTMIREAKAEAERRRAEAETEAASIISVAEQRVRKLESELRGVGRERGRLLADMRSAATALSELVDVSLQRFPDPDGQLLATPQTPDKPEPRREPEPEPAV